MRFQKKIFIANWKMNKILSESIRFFREVEAEVGEANQVYIAPSFCDLAALKEKFPKIRIGAQNVSSEEKGALTGEVSASMLKDIGVDFCLVGHSERRQKFFETDEEIQKKVFQLNAQEILPVLCIGETLEEKKKGLTRMIIEKQLSAVFQPLKSGIEKIWIAYEPVWAIGSSQAAEAEEIESLIRTMKQFVLTFSDSIDLKVLYGGSVGLDNLDHFLSQESIDGVLVGGASLDLNTFKNFLK